MVGPVDVQVFGEMPPGLLTEVTAQLVQDLERAGAAVTTAGGPARAGQRGALAVVGNFILGPLVSG
jgi:hypothetical protein